MVFPAICTHEIKGLPSDPLSLVFRDNIKGLQGDHVGFIYRQITDILPTLSDKVHGICRVMDPQQFHFPVPVPVKFIYHGIGVDASVCGAPDPLPQADDRRHVLFGCLDKQLILGHDAAPSAISGDPQLSVSNLGWE
mgnify:FL=1